MNIKMELRPLLKKEEELTELEKTKKIVNNTINIIFYVVIIILLVKGVIGKKFILEYTVGTVTSKAVKWFMHRH